MDKEQSGKLMWDDYKSKERQSVRTTFKITPGAIDILNEQKSRLHLSAKEIFDSAGEIFLPKLLELGKEDLALDEISETFKYANKSVKEEGKRKAFVVTRGFLRRLNEVSTKCDLNRDALVEGFLEWLWDSQRIRSEEIKAKSSKAMELLTEVYSTIDRTEKQLSQVFKGDLNDDFAAVLERLYSIRFLIGTVLYDIHEFNESGWPITYELEPVPSVQAKIWNYLNGR